MGWLLLPMTLASGSDGSHGGRDSGDREGGGRTSSGCRDGVLLALSGNSDDNRAAIMGPKANIIHFVEVFSCDAQEH